METPGPGHVGSADRAARMILGIVLVTFALFCPFAHSLGPLAVWGSGLVGAVLIVTAAIRRCPLYRLLGIRT